MTKKGVWFRASQAIQLAEEALQAWTGTIGFCVNLIRVEDVLNLVPGLVVVRFRFFSGGREPNNPHYEPCSPPSSVCRSGVQSLDEKAEALAQPDPDVPKSSIVLRTSTPDPSDILFNILLNWCRSIIQDVRADFPQTNHLGHLPNSQCCFIYIQIMKAASWIGFDFHSDWNGDSLIEWIDSLSKFYCENLKKELMVDSCKKVEMHGDRLNVVDLQQCKSEGYAMGTWRNPAAVECLLNIENVKFAKLWTTTNQPDDLPSCFSSIQHPLARREALMLASMSLVSDVLQEVWARIRFFDGRLKADEPLQSIRFLASLPFFRNHASNNMSELFSDLLTFCCCSNLPSDVASIAAVAKVKVLNAQKELSAIERRPAVVETIQKMKQAATKQEHVMKKLPTPAPPMKQELKKEPTPAPTIPYKSRPTSHWSYYTSVELFEGDRSSEWGHHTPSPHVALPLIEKASLTNNLELHIAADPGCFVRVFIGRPVLPQGEGRWQRSLFAFLNGDLKARDSSLKQCSSVIESRGRYLDLEIWGETLIQPVLAGMKFKMLCIAQSVDEDTLKPSNVVLFELTPRQAERKMYKSNLACEIRTFWNGPASYNTYSNIIGSLRMRPTWIPSEKTITGKLKDDLEFALWALKKDAAEAEELGDEMNV